MKNLAEPIATPRDYAQYDKSFDNSHILWKKDFISVTAVSCALMEADAIATCVSVFGKEKADEFLSKKMHVKCLALDSELNKYYFNNFEHIRLKVE